MTPTRRRLCFRRLVAGFVLLSTDPSRASAAAAVSIESLPFESGHDVKAGKGDGRGGERWCGVGELLPQPPATSDERSSEWSTEHVVEPPYGCSCASIKSRYFCPSLGSGGYPKWVPHSVASGACKTVTREEMMAEGPLPPDFKVLFYGNSHMRQVVESMACLFEEKVAVKRVTRFSASPASRGSGNAMNNNYNNNNNNNNNNNDFYDVDGSPPSSPYTKYEALVPGDTQCRACFDPTAPPHSVNRYEREMLGNDCIADGEECRCNDDNAEIFFDNGAIAHYYFASTDKHKSIADALEAHGGSPFSYYDAVFANIGNYPHMRMESVVTVAEELQAEGVPLFWLSTYEGYGELGNREYWSEEQVNRFRQSGARFLGIDRMARGLLAFTKGEVENIDDPHFCLPGPPNEMGLLLLKLAWAVHHRDDAH